MTPLGAAAPTLRYLPRAERSRLGACETRPGSPGCPVVALPNRPASRRLDGQVGCHRPRQLSTAGSGVIVAFPQPGTSAILSAVAAT
jgi:hypothetical protein